MGRSKFPGKPSKHVNRTRINVLSAVVNTTVAGEYKPTVVTVEADDNSKKADSSKPNVLQAKPELTPEGKLLIRKKRKDRVSIVSKRTPIKRGILLSTSTSSPLNSSSRLTRSKVSRRPARGFTIRSKLNKSKLSISPKKEQSNIVGKFVLPSRSVHSSRVIKPNKRFLNIEQSETIVKKRVINKKAVVKPEKSDVVSETEQVKDETDSDPVPVESKTRVVLRQARLQINTRTSIGMEGPFSTKVSSITSAPTTITCGVCGAVRFYRFIKQARKFNIYTCEFCRKFISKLIQHSNNKNITTLTCLKGQGSCPIVRNQQWKFNRIAYNSRCPACWLKLCLRSFQMPLALKTSLSNFLPTYMQVNTESPFSSSLPLLTWQSNAENKVDTIPALENTEIILRQRPVRIKPIKKEEKPVNPLSDIKRQKVDLKGPRVKHVCRSASIVLGQIPAVFPTDKKEEKSDVHKPDPEIDKPNEITAPDSAEVQEEPELKVPVQPSKKDKSKATVPSMLPIEIMKPSFSKKIKKISREDNQNLIDIDYWENYDPDEIICNGFNIISSESFPMQSICFLCGSAGRETLLHCCICCEPYHPYCLEQAPGSFSNSNEKYSWICPKCTTCCACGEADRQKINCQKCHKAYHPQCFNTKWRTDDRPTVCSNCLRCKSCGTDNITKFVGNVALCLQCFKLRNKGNYCPLCQCCYDDNDFDTKMMECGKCSKWVHAKCEGLSDEQYQILSILPESVEFLCRLCSNASTPYWRKAVQKELRSCFNNILRLLSKNRVARDMLKLSPFKVCTPTAKSLNSARRLEFINTEPTTNQDVDNPLDSDLEQVNAIFKNKIDFEDSFNSTALNDSKIPISPSMVEIKNKLNCNEYFSLHEFNEGMEHALNSTSSNELLNIYRSILKKVFPWFDPNQKDDLNKTICDASHADKNDEDKKICDRFDVNATDIVDTRLCNLCKGIGDGYADKEARLLYYGQNDWVHANCALWSSEVYEEIDGSLQNVQSAVSRGRSIRCAECKQKGATVGCCLKGCFETYHLPCAQKSECHFIADRTMYCKSHEIANKLNVLTNPREFEIKRSVYIEVDSKKKKFSERDKIHFMVGSLTVLNLGKIVPCVSDHVDVLIPVGFVCSRLFWSTTEPWKLIPYRITTSILNTQSHKYVDKNFTVDHSLPKHIIEKKIKDIYLWQQNDREKTDAVEFEDYEEPQNAADILSPELTDAILEELPRDLLDGISVQDMFSGYEEWMDFKNSEINCNDNLSLNMNSDSKFDEDDVKMCRDLKRSKSEVFQKIEDKMKPRNPQRSCSLTFQQLDNSPANKKRKLATSRDSMFMQLLQVDGACDSSGSECGSPTHESEYVWTPEIPEEPVTCEKCQCTYRTNASYRRHLESCDAMFTSESETENETLVVSVIDSQEPQVITSFETYSTYQATQNQIQSTVMNTQTILSESKVQENNGILYNYQQLKPIISHPQSNVINLNQPITINSTDGNSQLLNQFCMNQINQNVTLNQPNLISVDKNSLTLNPSIISVDNSQVMNQMNGIIDIQQPVTLQSVPYTPEVSPLMNLSQQNQHIAIETKMLAPNMVNSMVNIPQSQWVRPIIPQSKPRPRPRIVAKKSRVQGNTIVLPQNSPSVILQHIPSTNMLPFVDPFQQQTGQNVQYVATITPQINSTAINPQTQLVQLPENNFLSLVPNVQPTMIIQQPRVDAGQLIVDSNGSMVWTTQPVTQVQPVYYGFETIVQNTVMQSQQFLPTTVPGVLTTNSSYSATTQVFQTSKLEPVIDGNFVLVNPNTIVNQPAVSVPQIQANIPPQPVTSSVQMTKKAWNHVEQPPKAPQPTVLKPVHPPITVANNSNSITLPVAPFVPEQGIPTNIVTPTPKPPTVTQSSRPMSRVLPMPTSVQQKKQEKPTEKQIHAPEIQKIVHNEKQKITILEDVVVKECTPIIVTEIHSPGILKENKIIKPELPKEMKLEIEIPELKCTQKIAPLKVPKAKPQTITSTIIENKENTMIEPKQLLENVDDFKTSKLQKKNNNTSIFYKIESDDGIDYTDSSLPQIWRKIFNEVQTSRLEHNLPALPDIAFKSINDMDLLGLRTKGMKYLLEQLPDAIKCKTYKPIFHKANDKVKIEEDDNEDGSRRCLPYENKREKYDMFGWLSSKHRTLEMYDLDAVLKKNANASLPIAMRFRALKIISKYSVGVYRSEIHGRGLFSLRDIEAGEMVIEYAGEVIRSVLTDKRERYYNSKGIGCYMFRIDDNLVVDATMKGNAARFINHSCDPNCYSKVVEILGYKHIIIFALRKIICGEELTYDYKFPFEEDKIPCTCGTKRCRKFLN